MWFTIELTLDIGAAVSLICLNCWSISYDYNLLGIQDGERVLDVGCGRAFDAIQLVKKGGECFGLESSNRMINLAREQLAKDDIEIALIQGIGEYLPFKDSSLDKVICKGAIDHFPDPSKAFEEMARVLKPQGKAIIVVANFESLGFKLQRYLFRIM